MKKRLLLLFVILPLIAFAMVFVVHQSINCHFRPMTNFGFGRTVSMDMDLENAVNEGIIIPLEFRFIAPKKGMYYKVYYQNESYKFHLIYIRLYL